ncbi:fumarylacetoacetase [Sulfitobacter sp. KE34]|uniref:fumarylacetoacetase n=2 Tax=Sulfitobacter TaxID=60136 RepID=A0AAX3LND5_9RHOB|nr:MULTISPECIES: fumarylacetoacetase [Sulfitobacter]MDF3349563.1 fumarylacetoacetase [Sulfitobacter sp. KE12]MDF3353235.1 fumarylacetoacetase [Sulfitobacter sp. KE27]MDF3356882.1 fumarylacetoacetase [Sulfitobacter sp. KE33]MDF3362210.1 fumarylacetoacetase [Sulfitobacter sp. Ks41]MDF3364306.1 fumarylacetoacetase [Sulfitobacter sp. Ks34]
MTLMTSWVESANSATTDFPLNNLPYGVFSTNQLEARCGVAIGDQILDMAALEEEGLITLAEEPVFDVPYWNDVMDLGPTAWASLRSRLIELLSADAPDQAAVAPHLVPMEAAQLHMPMMVSEYTDFYAGKHHATNVGTMFRGAENALPPNWLHIPIGYNGRASTVVVSGTEITRPNGQLKAPEAETPHFGPCQKLDIELEMGAIVGTSTEMGQPVSITEADEMIFGYVLLNDWSARDIQAWEYQPLGPFQAKAFATSISPWIVTRDALEPFRTSTPEREKDLLPYLRESKPGLYDIDLSVTLQPEGGEAEEIARTNYREMYYSAAQQLTHHASSGCAMNAGDLLGSGTISGPEKSERGSLLELSWGGKEPITLTDGSTRSFVEDGDTLTLTGHAQGDGFRVGFGACTGKIRPAIDFS